MKSPFPYYGGKQMPHPDAMAAGFRFGRLLGDAEFRAYLLAGRCRGVPVVATYAEEDRAALSARVLNVAREHGTLRVLTVAIDESRPWGLRIEFRPGYTESAHQQNPGEST